MAEVVVLLPRMQAACEAVAMRVARHPVDRNVLMDMATVLTLVAYVLDRAEADVAGYAMADQALGVGPALRDLHESARWLHDRAGEATGQEILEQLDAALHHAIDALAILSRMDAT